MIFFLIVGILLGVLSVFFILQNTAVVTVSFFAWHIVGSLALVLFLAIASGVIIALLFVLPSLIKETLDSAALRRQNKKLEVDLIRAKEDLALLRPVPPTVTTTE